MSVSNPIKPLYKRLAAIGYTKKYVLGKVLPDWWEDCIAENPAGYQQAAMLLSRNLRLDLRTLLDENATIHQRTLETPKYKLRGQDTEDTVRVATCIAYRAAQLACHALPTPYAELPPTAMAIRNAILATGASCIGFEALLDYCWLNGIPVLHISEFPKDAHKPHALAAIVDGRPAIVLCKHTDYSAWLLFHLAHELGHIALGHLQGKTILVDVEIKGDTDTEEKEANQFAVELLTGFKQRSYSFGSVNAEQLATVATAFGHDTDVDGGFIALSHGRVNNRWGLANGALKIIEPSPNAVALVRERIKRNLDPELLSRDSADYLMRITGAAE
ncbi:hypothetical protein LBMAG21_10020 [Armatimonadota bacterium]|nr:hypothetical protein LBMAG21_10020 [Armatimonadota bacterium]